jgi:5-methylcytosine-specific restriction protein A
MSRYGPGWAALRLKVLHEEPFCVGIWPDTHAGERVFTTEVDHIVPLTQGGTNDRANLRGLCRSCNRGKSRDDRAENWRRG